MYDFQFRRSEICKRSFIITHEVGFSEQQAHTYAQFISINKSKIFQY